MASWTDKIPTFSPYVAQLPVDAMVQVGMYKQKQYDDGIQKIQTNIDNVAGLDIANNTQKQYLQSKLNQLGNDLRGVAAGDFSNFQLVNSVNGMTNQIVKDGIVQNAVSSTAWYRKQAADMEKAVAEGKSSQSNIYDFNDKASKWLNSTKLDASFRDRYTQYTDVKKKAMETIKALHPDLVKYDIPFKVDANGKMDTRFYADAMKRYKIEGVSEQKIAQALAATMSPDDLNQLKIDAKYEFRGAGFEQLAERAKTDYTTQKNEAVNALSILETRRAITTDPTKLNDIDDQIEQYKEKLGSDGKPGTLDENFYKNIEDARSNPDAVKYNIYKDGFVKEFANAFKWSSQEEEAVTNPYKEQENWVADMKLKQQIENRQRYEFGVNSQFKQADLEISRAKLQLDSEANALKKAELYGIDAPWTDLGNPTDNANRGQELFTAHVTSVDSSITSTKKALNDKGYDETKINAMLTSWNNAQGVVSKANVPANAIKDIMSIAKNQNYVSQLREFETKTRAESEQEAGVADIINKSLQGKSGLNFTHQGERLNLSAREVVDVKLAETKIKMRDNEGHLVERTVIDTGKLNPKQLKYAEAVYGKGMFGKYQNGQLVSSGLKGYPTSTLSDREAIDKITRPHVYAAGQIKQSYDKSEKLYMEKMGASSNAFVPRIKFVSKNSKGEIPSNMLDGVNQLIEAGKNKGIETDDKYSYETSMSYLTDANIKNTKIMVVQDGDKYEIQLKNSALDNGEPQRFKVNGSQVRAYLGDKYVNDNVQESTRFGIGKGKSDILGTNYATKAIMQKRFGDFPGIKKLQVTANLEEDSSGSGLFIPTIYVKQKDDKYVRFELSGEDKLSRVGYDQGKQNLNRLNDEVLLKTLMQAYPNYDFSKIDY